MRNYIVAVIAAVGIAGSAQAATIPAGTANFSFLFNPTVTTGTSSGSYAGSGQIFTTAASGGFAGSTGFGSSTGTFNFSNTAGTVVKSLPAFITFGDFTFDVASINTIAYQSSTASTAISLYLLVAVSKAGFDATTSSVTLQLNSTGGSEYSASASLANPPSAPGVPEPASWAMMLGGFGVLGGALRRTRRTSVTFA